MEANEDCHSGFCVGEVVILVGGGGYMFMSGMESMCNLIMSMYI